MMLAIMIYVVGASAGAGGRVAALLVAVVVL